MEESKKMLWFKAKRFGWGWYPCTWQGWGILVMYLFAVLVTAAYAEQIQPASPEVVVPFLVQIFILTVFLIIICTLTGEKPHWNWGMHRAEKKDTAHE